MSQQEEQQKLMLNEHDHQICIKRIDYANEYKLIQHRTNCQCYQDSQKFTVEFSKIALQGAFFLNGAGLVPIIYSKVDYFYSAGMWFAVGACAATLAACATFVYQDLATQTWYNTAFKKDASPHPEAYELELFVWKIRRDRLLYFRLCAVLLVAVSLSLFVVGLYQAGNNVDRPQTVKEKLLTAPTQNTHKRPQERISNPPLALDYTCESAHHTYHSNHD